MSGSGKRAREVQSTSMTDAVDHLAWSLVIPLEASEIASQQAAVLERLRHITGDSHLELQDFDPATATFQIRSNRDGFKRVHTLWKSKQLPMLLGIPVSNVQKITTHKRVAAAEAHQHVHQHDFLAGQATLTAPEPTPVDVEPATSDGQAEERLLYGHIQDCLFQEPPKKVLDRFFSLFVDGTSYEDSEIQAALDRFVLVPQASKRFLQVLNHCCYLAIDYWQFDQASCAYVPKLLALFHSVPDLGARQSRRIRFVRQVAQEFTQSDEYRRLQRLARVLNPSPIQPETREQLTLGDLIHRYPFLYRHCLLNDASSYEDQQTIKQIQSRIQHHLEFSLTRFVTYQVRLAQVAKARQLSSSAGRLLRREPNPTLLGNRELASALKHFFSRLPNSRYSHRELAQHFLYELDTVRTYAAFKTALHHYLLSPIAELPYCQQQFSDRLQAQITATLPHHDQHRLDESLILRTATKLINVLILDPQSTKHYLFIDLITNLGATMTVGLLLRLALICRPVLPEIERRLSLLFEHYEASLQLEVPWLVKVLENQNLAFSIHFGNADLSPLNQIARS